MYTCMIAVTIGKEAPSLREDCTRNWDFYWVVTLERRAENSDYTRWMQ
jgi:hypothetical protein